MLRLTTDAAPDFAPAWSPDSRRLAFLRGNAVYIIPVLGGIERKLVQFSKGRIAPRGTFPLYDVRISWSLDGKLLAFGGANSIGQASSGSYRPKAASLAQSPQRTLNPAAAFRWLILLRSSLPMAPRSLSFGLAIASAVRSLHRKWPAALRPENPAKLRITSARSDMLPGRRTGDRSLLTSGYPLIDRVCGACNSMERSPRLGLAARMGLGLLSLSDRQPACV